MFADCGGHEGAEPLGYLGWNLCRLTQESTHWSSLLLSYPQIGRSDLLWTVVTLSEKKQLVVSVFSGLQRCEKKTN